jgi:uncharacterized delta-60 repeat protein
VGRLNTNGTFDATFGTGGSVYTDVGPGTYGQGFAVVIQPDGRIIVAGSAGTTNGYIATSSFALIRYNPNGSLDGSFGSGGEVTTPFPFPNSRPARSRFSRTARSWRPGSSEVQTTLL